MINTSCGFIIKTEKGILGCHPTGRGYEHYCYDIPKGHMEEGETPLDTAKRELKEETGLDFKMLKVKYMYELRKRIYRNRHIQVIYLEVDKFPYDFDLHCDSTFIDVDGVEKPENDGYKWITDYTDFYKSLVPVIEWAVEEATLIKMPLEIGYYRHIESGKLYNLVQKPLYVKDWVSEMWDKNHYVLYRAMYENPDGPYFCRSKKSFLKNFEHVSDEEAHAMMGMVKKKRPRIGEQQQTNNNRLNLN